MTALHPAVDPLIDNPTPEQWLDIMSIALQSPMFENTWSVDAGSARRIVLTWDDGTHLSWIGCEGGEPDTIHVWNVSGEQPAFSPERFEWDDTVGVAATWPESTDEAREVIEQTIANHGTPTGCQLPWDAFSNDEFISEIVYALGEDGTFAEKLENADPDVIAESISMLEEETSEMADEDDEDGIAITGHLALALAAAGGLHLPAAWGGARADVVYGADYMPPNSPNARFMAFVKSIEDMPDWVVVWDECCGSCFRGTYEMLLKDSGLPEGTPALALFGQNTQYYFRPDGTVEYEFYQGNDAENAVIIEKATAAGLNAAITSNGGVLVSE